MNYNIPESSGYGGEEASEAALKLDRIGREILGICRDELYFSMRFMDVALSSFSYQMDTAASLFGTDGYRMYFNPRNLGGLYRQNRILVNRGYLHMVLHCIFRHLTKRGMDRRYWDLSCDIAAEHIIDGCDLRPVRFSRSLLRRETYRKLEDLPGAGRMGAYGKGAGNAGGRVPCGRPPVLAGSGPETPAG